MPLSFLGVSPETGTLYADAAAAIPGALLARREHAAAGTALQYLAQCAAPRGMIPISQTNDTPDPMANLWFIRAAHLFGQANGEDPLVEKLLPVSKRIVQEFITARGMGGVKMDNGGLLLTAPDQPATEGLRLNALWYSALESLAQDLDGIHAGGADHFERLAGRFRRSFAKSYWCEGHNCVCPPYQRGAVSHGETPDLEQLLLTILPASPIPRTKQRQVLAVIRKRSGSHLQPESSPRVGLLMDHPTLGRVESLLHRAWLGAGISTVADHQGSLAEVRAVLAPLQPLFERHGSACLPAFYRDGRPIAGLPPDPLTSAEVFAALRQANMA